jgi:hypothetical protein
MMSRRAVKTKKAQIDSRACGRKEVVEEVVESGLGKRGKLYFVGMWRACYFHICFGETTSSWSRATFNGTYS